jgi:N-acetyl sugar amidotransferase
MINYKDYADPHVLNNPNTDSLHQYPYRMCTKTVMDTSDPNIIFDENGVCNYANEYFEWYSNKSLKGEKAENKVLQISNLLKRHGNGKEYDCIIGLSGGVDSSYLCYFVTQILGLKPLVVHVDTGWNSEIAVNNIYKIVKKLNLDLHTYVIDWQEMRDLQLSYFKSGIANLDVPQDHSFIACLYREAAKYNIKYVMNGSNMATESVLPKAWGYDASDSKNLLSIHKKYGTLKLKNYPRLNLFEYLIFYPFIKGIKEIRILDYIEYNKNKAVDLLKKEFDWRDYGGKHYESNFTKFFQAHYLPTKFGYNKKKAHLSSLILSGLMSREEAINELNKPLYNPVELDEDRNYFCKKLGISIEEYFEIMQKTPVKYSDFPNQERQKKVLRHLFSFANKFRRI